METKNAGAVLTESRPTWAAPWASATPAPSSCDPLSLQAIEVVEAPADVYRSANSVYTCIVMSGFSIGC